MDKISKDLKKTQVISLPADENFTNTLTLETEEGQVSYQVLRPAGSFGFVAVCVGYQGKYKHDCAGSRFINHNVKYYYSLSQQGQKDSIRTKLKGV